MNQDRLLKNWIAPALDPDSKVPTMLVSYSIQGTRNRVFEPDLLLVSKDFVKNPGF